MIAPGEFSTIAVDGNTIQANPGGVAVGDSGSDGIQIEDGGTLTGTVRGNTIGSGTNGIDVTASGSGTETLAITGNHLSQYSDGAGINFIDQAGNPAMNLTITGNTIADPGANGNWGIRGQDGGLTSDSGTVCAVITGNSIAGSGPAGRRGGADVELDQNDGTTINLPGYTGGSGNTSAVESFLAGNNDGDGTPTAVATVSGTGGGFVGVTGC